MGYKKTCRIPMWVNQERLACRKFQDEERPCTMPPLIWLPSEELQACCPVAQAKASLLPRRQLSVVTALCNAFIGVVNITDSISPF